MSRRNLRWTAPAGAVAITALTLASLVSSAPSAAHQAGPDSSPDPLWAAAAGITSGPAWTAKMRTQNITVVGHTDLGGHGLNADVWEHRGFAYVGVWSGTCPANGVKVADVQNPRHPTRVSRLPNPAGTSAEDVVVRHVETDRFSGELAVVGIQTCDDPTSSPVFRGLQFFDVTNPRAPRELSRFQVAEDTVGCHEVDLVVRQSSVLAGCANAFAEQITGTDEVVVVDVTNPFRPHKVGGFAVGKDLGVDPATTRQNVGAFPATFAHSVRFTHGGDTLFASYWDYGTLRFHVRDSGALRGPVGRSDLAPPDEDADNHSMTLAKGGGTMVVNPEDFSPVEGCPECGGWGEAYVYTNGRGDNRPVSSFSTRHSRSMRTDGFYTVHNTETAGSRRAQLFSSWYSDGVVWWSVADRRDPVKKGQFVPPPTEDPSGVFPPVPLVWGVYADRTRNLIYASDLNSGLWILRPTGLGSF
ncbi:MAG: hypothetical protein H0U77_09530 [Nocardioidaceae bacterium]|nr:hypothetical protein [Nocardioidaceae bacterium]